MNKKILKNKILTKYGSGKLSSTSVVFAQGLCKQKLFLIFLIGSIIGAYYEQILHLIGMYIKTNTIVWEYRRGVIYGPFNVIYGFGAVIMTLLFVPKNYKWYQIILYGALLGGGVEYIVSFLQETFTHTTSWDYSERFLNINGRTTIPYMIIWGIFSLIFVKYLYPFVSKLIESIPYSIGTIFTKIMLIFMIFNMVISWSAIIRQTLRRNNVPPITNIGKFYDKYYPDEYLAKYFPNMVPKKEND